MDEFYRKSRLTGREYNVFDTVKILNLTQVAAYMNRDVLPVDIVVGTGKEGRPILVFYYMREETKEVYDLWCRHEI